MSENELKHPISWTPSSSMMDYTEEIQKDMLALMWYEKDKKKQYLEIESVPPESFTTVQLHEVAGVIYRYYQDNNDVPTLNSLRELLYREYVKYGKEKKESLTWESYEDLLTYFQESKEQRTESEIMFLRRQLMNYGKYRAISNAVMAITHKLDDVRKKHLYDTDYMKEVDNIYQKASKVGVLDTTESSFTLDGNADIDKLCALFDPEDETVKEQTIPTGSKILDGDGVSDPGVMLGGVKKGEMFLIMAPTAYGKTSGLISHGVAALKAGKSVYHVTIENNPDQINRWYMQNMTNLSQKEMREMPRDERQKRMNKAVSDYMTSTGAILHVSHWGIRTQSVAGISADLDMLESREGFKPDVIIIDYGALLRPKHDYKDSKWMSLTEIYEDIAGLSTKHNAAVYTAVQTNRGGYNAAKDGGTDLSHIAGAYNIAAVADYILSYNHDKSNGDKLYATLAKNREGRSVIISGDDKDVNLSTRRVYFNLEYTPKDLSGDDDPDKPKGKRKYTKKSDYKKKNSERIVLAPDGKPERTTEDNIDTTTKPRKEKSANETLAEYKKVADGWVQSYIPPTFCNGSKDEYIAYIQSKVKDKDDPDAYIKAKNEVDREKATKIIEYMKSHPDEYKIFNAKYRRLMKGEPLEKVVGGNT